LGGAASDLSIRDASIGLQGDEAEVLLQIQPWSEPIAIRFVPPKPVRGLLKPHEPAGETSEFVVPRSTMCARSNLALPSSDGRQTMHRPSCKGVES